jgi:glycosyltransferase involved in cell wall biosynthesis
MRVTIHITTKDRATEVAMLLQSLRTQTFEDWDLILLDDASGTPLISFQFIQSIINRLKLEGHRIKILRNDFSKGVCSARQRCIDEDTYDNDYVLRLDDDCLPEFDYIQKLLWVLQDYKFDIATGVIPLISVPEFKRGKTPELICEHKVDSKGNLSAKDELGYCYLNRGVVPCHQFRTNALFKKEVLEKVKYPINLSNVGFREELHISFQALLNGFRIGCDTGAVAYHLQTLSGGCRDPDYSAKVALDHETTMKWVKKNKTKLRKVLK